MVEFTCEGCGRTATNLPLATRPAPGFCVVCAFLSDTLGHDPEEMMKVRAWMTKLEEEA